jgi:hypothetical protein
MLIACRAEAMRRRVIVTPQGKQVFPQFAPSIYSHAFVY